MCFGFKLLVPSGAWNVDGGSFRKASSRDLIKTLHLSTSDAAAMRRRAVVVFGTWGFASKEKWCGVEYRLASEDGG